MPLTTRTALGLVFFGIAMFALAILGYVLHYTSASQSVATCWPASGLFLAALVKAPVRSWWVYILVGFGAFTASDLAAARWSEALETSAEGWAFIGAIANVIEAVIGATVVRLICRDSLDIAKVPTILALILAAAVGTTSVSAAIGAFGVVLTVPDAQFWSVWQVWWFGDAMGIVVVAPFVLAMGQPICTRTHASRTAWWVEGVTLFVILGAVIYFVLGAERIAATSLTGFPYLVTPVLIWAALRFGRRFVASCVLVTALSAALFFDQGRGPFAWRVPVTVTNVLSLQLFMLTTCVSALLISSAMLQWRATSEHHLDELAQRKEHEERLEVLLHELNHRVRNNLGTLIGLTEVARDDELALERLYERVRAMARVHTVLSGTMWNPTPLNELIDAAAPTNEHERIHAEGPRVIIRPECCQSLVLVLHELAFNSTKWGALSTASGVAEVRWSLRGDQVVIEWLDTVAPVDGVTRGSGDGHDLLRGLIEGDLQGTVSFDVTPTRFRCSIAVPVRETSVDGRCTAEQA